MKLHLLLASALFSASHAFAAAHAAAQPDEAKKLYYSGRFPEALSSAEAWAAADPSSADALLLSGLSQLALGDASGAKARFEQALKARPRHPDALNNLALIECRQGRPSQAYALFDLADAAIGDKESPQAGLPLSNAAACASLWRDRSKEKSYLALAMRSHPSYAPAYYQMAQALYQEGAYGEVEAYLRPLRALLTQPDPMAPPAEDIAALGALAAKALASATPAAGSRGRAKRSASAREEPSGRDRDASRARKQAIADVSPKPSLKERASAALGPAPKEASKPMASPRPAAEMPAPPAQEEPQKPKMINLPAPTQEEREARIREARESSERVRAAMGQPLPKAAPSPAQPIDRFKAPAPSSAETLFEH